LDGFQATGWKGFMATDAASIQSESTSSGEFALTGAAAMHMMSKSPTTIAENET
jgi:hypothetical protein